MMDEFDDRQGRKLGPMAWSCNCQAPTHGHTEPVYTKMYPTTVDEEGICTQCGFYAYQIEEYILSLKKARKRGMKYKTA